MDPLVTLLSDIVSAEYAQWMRYTYLSSLGYGLHTDVLSTHFKDHGSDELEHADIISRWIVDLDGAPPTHLTPVEQFCGSTNEAINWLIDAEVAGIEKYNYAYLMAECIPALQQDIAEILSTEHDHLSDLNRMLDKDDDSDDVIVVIADKNATSMNEMFNWLRANLSPYIQEYADHPPAELKKVALELIESIVLDVYQGVDSPQKRQTLWDYKQLYEMISNTSESEWMDALNYMYPDLGVEVPGPPTFEDVMRGVEPPEWEPEEEVETKQPEQPFDIKKQLEQYQQQLRPPEKELVDTIKVYNPGKSRKEPEPTQEVGIGDLVKNMTLSGPDIPDPGRPGRASWSEGEIVEIIDDNTLKVRTPKGDQTWNTRQDLIEVSLRGREKLLFREGGL